MKVLIVEPGKYPREADIEHTLEAEQAVVGGTIEAVYPWRDSACIVCNDNGIAENLPLNRMLSDYDIIHGTFFVCLLYLELHRVCNFKASRGGIFGQGVDVLLAVVRQFEGIIRDWNTMRFVVGCPSVDDLIIRITDRQRSARQ